MCIEIDYLCGARKFYTAKMHPLFRILTALVFLGISSCTTSDIKEMNEQEVTVIEPVEVDPIDNQSYSNCEDVRSTHLTLDLNVNFEAKKLTGYVKHDIENSTGVTTMIFDVNQLAIDKVVLDESDPTEFVIGEYDPIKGSPMHVKIKPETKSVTIYYSTQPESKALQWLDPQQTAGKKFPYLFTQGEAVLTRTWIPCQDSPQNRITYDATLQVPSNLLALMAADNNPTKKNSQGKYTYSMDIPIPSYLIALAVGDLEFQSTGERTGVYASPVLLEAAAYEFAEVEEMISVTESLYGEYLWGRYDILVLPTSFPYGGMENPKLTFATPTIITGDRSLVSLIAHELAHSWSGNLVTNATWDDFWLNEGFTVYIENRIMEAIHGKEHADMLFSIEYEELEIENEEILAGEFPEDSKLKLKLEGRDPDDGMTTIAYIKGALFLKTLEELVGRDKFDPFVKSYFADHQFQTLTTEAFIIYLNDNLLTANDLTFNTDEWIYGEGIPVNCVKITSNRFDRVEEKDKMIPGMKSTSDLGLNQSTWSTQEWMHFIRQIPKETTLPEFDMMEQDFGFSQSGNAEIQAEWFIRSIKQGRIDPIKKDLEEFLIRVGRRKFLEPIYEELAKSPSGLTIAVEVYVKARPNYHSISYQTIDEILDWEIKKV